MSAKYLSCADTAKLVRQALKESFPGVKFSVRSSTYSMGASVRVEWLDGPNTDQVEAVTGVFQGSYFDGGIDYKGSIYHMMDGQQVRFGADSIHCNRRHSEAATQAAIDRIYRRYAGNFKEAGIEKPTPAQYESGELWSVHFRNFFDNLQTLISEALYKHTYRFKAAPSKTAARVFITHDDGYSRMCGAGMSAVPLNE